MGLSLIFGAVTLAFLAMTGAALFHLRYVRRLPEWRLADDAASASRQTARVRCSVVIPARDEEDRIEETLRRALAQQGVDVEVIVVDDRSSDRTGDIVQQIAAQDARVRPMRVESLPADWLGKCHACHLGAESATGTWILFTDADCWLAPDVIARALHVAQRDDAEHITLTPGVAPRTLAGRACHLIILMSLADWISRVNRDIPQASLGIGAFNLVRTDAYHRCGGYQDLHLTVVDDLKLGLLLQRAGARTRAFLGGADAECQWGITARSMIKILEKNYFAAMEFRLERAMGASVGGVLIWAAAVAGPFMGTAAGIAAGLSLASLVIPTAILARRLHWPLSVALATPLILPLLLYAVFNSTWKTLRQGGIRWRDTFYSLDTLRRGAVR